MFRRRESKWLYQVWEQETCCLLCRGNDLMSHTWCYKKKTVSVRRWWRTAERPWSSQRWVSLLSSSDPRTNSGHSKPWQIPWWMSCLSSEAGVHQDFWRNFEKQSVRVSDLGIPSECRLASLEYPNMYLSFHVLFQHFGIQSIRHYCCSFSISLVEKLRRHAGRLIERWAEKDSRDWRCCLWSSRESLSRNHNPSFSLWYCNDVTPNEMGESLWSSPFRFMSWKAPSLHDLKHDGGYQRKSVLGNTNGDMQVRWGGDFLGVTSLLPQNETLTKRLQKPFKKKNKNQEWCWSSWSSSSWDTDDDFVGKIKLGDAEAGRSGMSGWNEFHSFWRKFSQEVRERNASDDDIIVF